MTVIGHSLTGQPQFSETTDKLVDTAAVLIGNAYQGTLVALNSTSNSRIPLCGPKTS